jgi:hypothetical protein
MLTDQDAAPNSNAHSRSREVRTYRAAQVRRLEHLPHGCLRRFLRISTAQRRIVNKPCQRLTAHGKAC